MEIKLFLAIFQSERLGSGKTLSKLHIFITNLFRRVYLCRVRKTLFEKILLITVTLKMIDVIDEKQMHDSLIVGKENASNEWNSLGIALNTDVSDKF